MPHAAIVALTALVAVPALALLGFMVYVAIRYTPIIARVFEAKPVFHPLRARPEPGGEEVRFKAADGVELAGTYLPTRAARRAGVVVFCHEFLGDRWSALAYADGLRGAGFDLFTFDFRNHGESQSVPDYQPLQWTSDVELRDLGAALDYVRSRPDRDPAGVGLFGISRGGSTALCVAAADPGVWGVVTDGAFPTRGTMTAYILKWAEIYVGTGKLWQYMPLFLFRYAGWAGRVRLEWRLRRRFPDVEAAVARLAPRPWLMIHGARDVYISAEIAAALFARAREPKSLWMVPEAKHNRCRDLAPEEYRARLAAFFRQASPRRPVESAGSGRAGEVPALEAAAGDAATPALSG